MGEEFEEKLVTRISFGLKNRKKIFWHTKNRRSKQFFVIHIVLSAAVILNGRHTAIISATRETTLNKRGQSYVRDYLALLILADCNLAPSPYPLSTTQRPLVENFLFIFIPETQS
ncbi:hypothetical protein QWY14_09435 [Planococcus sp. N028]|uniref:Transposase n=1 Tax=Planococcus shixiaomingii TaxID=3058393 RepID=A0ABT8N2B3_9BACL|nr:hypothetical protein [Planococcus sp. N028]MDN7242020.1 hypothetical protein [Planococcus sp. N028]